MKSNTGIIKIRGERHLPHRINKLAIVASVLAFTMIIFIVLTFIQADNLMRREAEALTSFTSNIMPDYRLASFPSLDEQTNLSGWFFPAVGTPLSTIILVHDNAGNRLQFDLDSPKLFELLVNSGYNVLAFDLRNSGKSEGSLSTYGYGEWADVLAAIQYARQYASTEDVILYGFGSGVSAALMAWQELLPSDTKQEDIPSELKRLTYDRDYIKAVILDTPAVSPDEYISADCRDGSLLGDYLLQHTVPYAIRLSAGHSGRANLITIVSQMQIPVFITWSESDNFLGTKTSNTFSNERIKLYPDLTHVYISDAEGYLQSWFQDQEDYATELTYFLRRYVSKS